MLRINKRDRIVPLRKQKYYFTSPDHVEGRPNGGIFFPLICRKLPSQSFEKFPTGNSI